MKRKILVAACALVAGLGAAGAQDIEVSGRVINAPLFDAGRRLVLSQNDYIYGTSRSAAMGGAFASLGADLSSMNINPAGLGMYQGSDWGFTQALSINTMKTGSEYMRPGALSSNGSRVSYGLGNLGVAYNLFNRSGTLTSLTIGFSYNRAANFNSRSRVETTGEDASIAEMFQNQLNLMAGDVPADDLKPSAHPFNNGGIYFDEWGAVLAYQTGLVRHSSNGYSMIPGAIPSDSYFGSVTRGGIYEYGFSLGANIGNYLYMGATIGVTQVNYREETSYEESYPNSPAAIGMWFDQSTRIAGSGLTAKLGLVARPIPELRVGLAFHLPTYYTVEKSYTGEMGVGSGTANTGDALVDQQQFNTAPRLLTGISGIIGDMAILAVDYEAAWYNKIRMRNAYQSDIDDSKAESDALYRTAHTLRAGLEVRASDVFSIRAGGSYLFDFMKDKNFVANNPTARSGYTVTAGFGVNVGRNSYIDMAYVFNRSRYTNYDYFYFRDGDIISSQYDMVGSTDFSREYTPKRNHHMITLTFGSRF